MEQTRLSVIPVSSEPATRTTVGTTNDYSVSRPYYLLLQHLIDEQLVHTQDLSRSTLDHECHGYRYVVAHHLGFTLEVWDSENEHASSFVVRFSHEGNTLFTMHSPAMLVHCRGSSIDRLVWTMSSGFVEHGFPSFLTRLCKEHSLYYLLTPRSMRPEWSIPRTELNDWFSDRVGQFLLDLISAWAVLKLD